MKIRYESEILEMCHEDAMDMYKSGLISDERMREFDEMCLPAECLSTDAPRVSFSANDVPARRLSPIVAHSARK